MKLLGCALIGLLAAGVGAVISPGVFGIAWLGFALAVILVISGAVASWEIGKLAGGLIYVAATVAATFWVTAIAPSDDILAPNDSWAVALWPLTATAMAVAPLLMLSRRKG